MNNAQLTRKIKDLSEKLKPVASEGIRIDFDSFTEPEQLVLLKNFELQEKYGSTWPRQVILANKELIVKANEIAAKRTTELFLFIMPRAFMLDEVEQYFFKLNFDVFLGNFTECLANVKKWSDKDREDFLLETKPRNEETRRKKRSE